MKFFLIDKNKYTQFILNLTISCFYVLFTIIIITYIFPEGKNVNFLLRSSKLVGLVFSALCVIFLVSWILNGDFKFKKKFNLPEYKDFLLLALPISPVLDYAFLNVDYLNLIGLIYLITATLAFTIFLSFIFPIFFSYFGSYKILMISGLALSFTILSMAKIVNNPNDHLLNSQFATQGLYLIISFGVLYLLYLFNKKIAYFAVIFFMISGVTIQLANYSFKNLLKIETNDSKKLKNFLTNKENAIIKRKNIYILIYESYAGLETLNYYGFDNTEHIEFLEKKGFKIYHGIYSIGSVSLDTTSRILEIEGEISKHPRYYTSGNAFALNIFKANQYKTISLFPSPYYFGGYPISWSESYPKSDVKKIGSKMITESIFSGHFRFDIFNKDFSYEKYLQLKKNYLTSIKNPSFFYTHNNFPGHSEKSGKCRTNEKEIYFTGLKKANIEMKTDVSDILKNDPNSIIVLLGDHGPYITKNCKDLRKYDINTIDKYDLQDRYGTFLSIHWPKDISYVEQNIMITQDIVPAILSNITKNKNLFNELKIERRFFDRFENQVAGINVINGIITNGKDKGKPLFDKRTYKLGK